MCTSGALTGCGTLARMGEVSTQSKASLVVLGVIAAAVLTGTIIFMAVGSSQGTPRTCEGTTLTDRACFR